MTSEQISIRDVAERAGVHFTTAAKALRGAPGVAAATVRRVETAAAELGYRPNPMVAALMASHRRRRQPQAGTLIAIAAWPGQDPSRLLFWQREYRGALTRANALGFRVEILDYFGSSPRRFEQILHTRGIQGLLVMPVQTGVQLDLDWSRYAAVALGNTYKDSRLHRVAPSYTENVTLALDRLHERGYRRPGLAILLDSLQRTGGGSLHGFAGECLMRFGQLPVPPLTEDLSPEKVRRWVTRERPDAILTLEPAFHKKLEAVGVRVPEDCAVVNLSIHDPKNATVAGIDQCLELIGERAVEVVSGMLNRNERGLSQNPRIVLHQGEWVEGSTVRPVLVKAKRFEKNWVMACHASNCLKPL